MSVIPGGRGRNGAVGTQIATVMKVGSKDTPLYNNHVEAKVPRNHGADSTPDQGYNHSLVYPVVANTGGYGPMPDEGDEIITLGVDFTNQGGTNNRVCLGKQIDMRKDCQVPHCSASENYKPDNSAQAKASAIAGVAPRTALPDDKMNETTPHDITRGVDGEYLGLAHFRGDNVEPGGIGSTDGYRDNNFVWSGTLGKPTNDDGSNQYNAAFA